MKRYLILLHFVLAMLIALPVYAVEPEEVLQDAALETRAREISKGLRCLVCRNENIDSSNAGIAKDLRLLVRERLVAGDTDAQTVAFIVDRYGEFVLLKPQFSLSNGLLWAFGPMSLLLGMFLVYHFIRRKNAPETDILSETEQNRIAKILKD